MWNFCRTGQDRTGQESSVRFFGLGFFHGSTLYGPQISRLKGFCFLFRFREVIQIFRWIPTVSYCGDYNFFWEFQQLIFINSTSGCISLILIIYFNIIGSFCNFGLVRSIFFIIRTRHNFSSLGQWWTNWLKITSPLLKDRNWLPCLSQVELY
jgi:hypothetical protein